MAIVYLGYLLIVTELKIKIDIFENYLLNHVKIKTLGPLDISTNKTIFMKKLFNK